MMGIEQPISGSVRLGQYNVHPNYFEQNQAEALDLEQTALSTLVQAVTKVRFMFASLNSLLQAPDARLDDIKALLGRMMFTGSAMDKKCKVLSGGEKARLAMAKFMLAKGTPSPRFERESGF